MLNRVENDDVIQNAVLLQLKKRGVNIEEISQLVYDLQKNYNPELTLDICFESIIAVLHKRELQHAILVGIELDILAERKELSEPLQSLIETDDSLFGCDETLALGASMVYGSIAVTTFGYLDKNKIGLIKRFDSQSKNGKVHTFLDDIICAIAAMAAARIAHRSSNREIKGGEN